MSRLQPLFIPFAGGANDQVDKRLLPNGVFAELQNARVPAAGSLRLRRGWRPLVMKDLVNGSTLTAFDLYSFNDSLVAAFAQSDNFTVSTVLGTYTPANAARPWVVDFDTTLPPATQVRKVGNVPAMSTAVIRASAALTSDGVYGCVLQQSSTESIFHVFKRETNETLVIGSLSNGSRVRKVVSMGTKFGLVENTGSGLDLYSLDPTANGPTWTSVATLFSATVTWFDVAVASETTPTALHIADVVAGAGSYRKFSFAGVQSGSTKTVTAGPIEAATLCCDDTFVKYVYQDDVSHELSLISFSAVSPFTTSAGPTALNAGVPIVEGLFCVGMSTGASPQCYIASEQSVGGATDLKIAYVNKVTHTHGANSVNISKGQQLCGGWLTRGLTHAAGFTRRPTGTGLSTPTGATSMYLDVDAAPWFYVDFGNAAQFDYQVHPPFMPAQCPTGDALVLLPRDDTPNTSVTPRSLTCRALKVRDYSRRPGATVNGGLYVTGGVLSEWVGGTNDNGQLFPIIDSLAPSNGSGTLANGVYQYRAVMVWQDEAQNTHRSIVSGPAQVTLAGANDTVTATVYAPKTLRRNYFNQITGPRIELYRTEAGPGELFYLVGSGAVGSTNDAVTITDTLPDASIVDEALLYTQGETGAVSGILDQSPARPASYVAATKRRLVLGSADTAYQWSQVSFPETPMWFAEPGVSGDSAQAYLDDVEGGRITAVFALDEQAFIATADRIYVTGGVGPNLAGVGGEFSPPQRLPADVGVYDWRSVLDVGDGVWFRGSATRMYLLPRGAAAPTEQRAVQEHLTSSLNIVGAGYEATDGVGMWALDNATALVRQTAIDLWAADTLPFTPIALIGHAGRLYAVASDGVVWAQDASAFGDGSAGATAPVLRVATGPIQVFDGFAGHGRVGCIELMGEFQAAATVLGEVSYDDGLTWTSLGSYSVTGLSAGETFQRQWFPARQRGGRFRVRFTMTPTVSTTEGCRLAGCTVYYTKASGQTRLASANRK